MAAETVRKKGHTLGEYRKLCSDCGYVYYSNSGYWLHKKKFVCEKYQSERKPLICQDCGRYFLTEVECQRHKIFFCTPLEPILPPPKDLIGGRIPPLRDQIKMRFPTLDEFFRWKESIEKATNGKFTIDGGTKSRKNKEYVYYTCERNFYVRNHNKKNAPKRLTERRNLKGLLTNVDCPARMNLKILGDGVVCVTFIHKHVNHIPVNTETRLCIHDETPQPSRRRKRASTPVKKPAVKKPLNTSRKMKKKQAETSSDKETAFAAMVLEMEMMCNKISVETSGRVDVGEITPPSKPAELAAPAVSRAVLLRSSASQPPAQASISYPKVEIVIPEYDTIVEVVTSPPPDTSELFSADEEHSFEPLDWEIESNFSLPEVEVNPPEVLETTIGNNNDKIPTLCYLCGKLFSNRNSYYLHKMRLSCVKDLEFPRTCITCNTSFTKKSAFCSKNHKCKRKIDVKMPFRIHKMFGSMGEFLEWKDVVEAETKGKFTVDSGTKSVRGKKYIYYTCNRNFVMRSHRRKGEPARLTDRTHKKPKLTNVNCPARMNLQITEAGIKMTFLPEHANHVPGLPDSAERQCAVCEQTFETSVAYVSHQVFCKRRDASHLTAQEDHNYCSSPPLNLKDPIKTQANKRGRKRKCADTKVE